MLADKAKSPQPAVFPCYERTPMNYDFRRRYAETPKSYRTTAGVLARILYRCRAYDLLPDMKYDSEYKGHYPGTQTPLRRVPEEAPVTLVLHRGGGRVEDQAGGWIADRFGPALGLTVTKRAVGQLEREGVLPEG